MSTSDFWDPISEAGVSKDADGNPKFSVTFRGRTLSVYFNEGVTRKTCFRRLTEGSPYIKEDKVIVDRIVDDLFDKFGQNNTLEWDPSIADSVNIEWAIRMLRRDLRKRGVPDRLSRQSIDMLLNELYEIEPVLSS